MTLSSPSNRTTDPVVAAAGSDGGMLPPATSLAGPRPTTGRSGGLQPAGNGSGQGRAAARFSAESAAMTPSRMLVLLYERLIRDLDDAEVSIGTGDRYGANVALLHAQEIVSELERALDPQVWNAAGELSSIYMYVQGRLVRANIAQDLTALAQCREAIEPLRVAWTEAWQQVSQGVPTAGGAAVPGGPTVDGGRPTPAPAAERVPLDIAG
jgi:flagellar secretion chaperone FliS